VSATVLYSPDTVAITLRMYGADLINGTSVRRTYQQRPEDAAS
jgi:hypothetical protein